MTRGGKLVSLGFFATAEEAALHVARSPEGQAAARRAAASESQGTLSAVPPVVYSTHPFSSYERELPEISDESTGD